MQAEVQTPTDPLERLRRDMRGAHAYAVQDARGLLKLDAMENPYRLAPELQAELGRRLGAVAINRYPGPRVDALRAALAAYARPPEGWQLILGNGSDEIITLLTLACAQAGASVLAPEPSFVMYAMSAQFYGLDYHGVPLRADFALDEPAMLAAIARHRPSLVFLACPNNPTGTLWQHDAVQHVIDAQRAHGGMVVLDEAYQPFAARTWLDDARAAPQAYGNVFIMRTLSKFGLAGVRVGYLMGPARLVGEVDKLRPPYNVSLLDVECALFALEHAEVYAAQAAAIRSERTRLLQALAAVPEVIPYPSEANMILTRVPDAERAFAGMKARGVLVKNVSKMHPLIAQCLRLTVGTAEENTRMLAALQASL